MSSLFDGISGLINDVFGSPMTYTTHWGASSEVRAILRHQPVDLVDDQGLRVRDLGPTLRARRCDLPDLRRGDRITLPDGRAYEVAAVWPSGSPAADGFFVADLTELDT